MQPYMRFCTIGALQESKDGFPMKPTLKNKEHEWYVRNKLRASAATDLPIHMYAIPYRLNFLVPSTQEIVMRAIQK